MVQCDRYVSEALIKLKPYMIKFEYVLLVQKYLCDTPYTAHVSERRPHLT